MTKNIRINVGKALKFGIFRQYKIRSQLTFVKFASLIVSCFILGCSIQKHNADNHCVDFEYIQLCEPHLKYTPNAGIDSKTGRLTTAKMTLDVDFGQYSYTGPETLKEYMWKTFRSYHYMQFFEDRHIDKKVKKMFRDSVSFESFEIITQGSSKNCKSCNFRMNLKFKDYTYPFDINIQNDLANELNANYIQIDTVQGMIVRTYFNSAIAGAYISKENGSKTDNKLSLTLHEGTFEDLKIFTKNNINSTLKNGIKK